MNAILQPWDYLIVTASNESQARAYETQLALRNDLGFLSRARHVLVVADPEGRRVGSGGSTICCLMQVVNQEWSAAPSKVLDAAAIEGILRQKRILIVHAGGDSRRLPAYGPCGKIFIPIPGESKSALGLALFDRLVPDFMALPSGCEGDGQIVVTAGDALTLFDPTKISFAQPGMTALVCADTPEHASKHGVFCMGAQGRTRLYLQKPSPEIQRRYCAIDPQGQSYLDIGIMSFDARMAMAMLQATGVTANSQGQLDWPEDRKRGILERGVDFFREICCAMGDEATSEHHREQAQGSGSTWNAADLEQIFNALKGIPFHVQVLPQCRFLHFGTTRQLITSGLELIQMDAGNSTASDAALSLDNEFLSGGEIEGSQSWVEGCRLSAPLRLAGQNVVIGADVSAPLSFAARECLDILSGPNRNGQPVWFVRCYGIKDTFKDSVIKGGTLCGRPLAEWLVQAGVGQEDVWDAGTPPEQRSLWNARVFPAVSDHSDYQHWLWMFKPGQATPEQKAAFLKADRYSAADIAVISDQPAFFKRRGAIRAVAILPKLPEYFRSGSAFSAAELAYLLKQDGRSAGAVCHLPSPSARIVLSLLQEAKTQADGKSLDNSRILHSIGTAVNSLIENAPMSTLEDALPGIAVATPPSLQLWLEQRGLQTTAANAKDWAKQARCTQGNSQ